MVKISPGNRKMGSIPSVSLPAGLTCRKDCDCAKLCYAMRMERYRKSVHKAYQSNYELLQSDPATYWREVEGTIMMSRYFRFHVSGDIPDNDYLVHMAQIAARNPHCEILCFTKKYRIVNGFLRSGGMIPKNMHLILSAWRGTAMENPYSLPEAHVLYKDGSTTAGPSPVPCGGNCTECARTDGGCWSLRLGDQVVFHEH